MVPYLIVEDHHEADTKVFKMVHAFCQIVTRARALEIKNEFLVK